MHEVLSQLVGKLGMGGNKCRQVHGLAPIDAAQIICQHRIQIGLTAAILNFRHRAVLSEVRSAGTQPNQKKCGPAVLYVRQISERKDSRRFAYFLALETVATSSWTFLTISSSTSGAHGAGSP